MRNGMYDMFHAQLRPELIDLQLLNILFAICGITGALYGIGQRSDDLVKRGTIETAMFVC